MPRARGPLHRPPLRSGSQGQRGEDHQPALHFAQLDAAYVQVSPGREHVYDGKDTICWSIFTTRDVRGTHHHVIDIFNATHEEGQVWVVVITVVVQVVVTASHWADLHVDLRAATRAEACAPPLLAVARTAALHTAALRSILRRLHAILWQAALLVGANVLIHAADVLHVLPVLHCPSRSIPAGHHTIGGKIATLLYVARRASQVRAARGRRRPRGHRHLPPRRSIF